jgi:hypothetical protein
MVLEKDPWHCGTWTLGPVKYVCDSEGAGDYILGSRKFYDQKNRTESATV